MDSEQERDDSGPPFLRLGAAIAARNTRAAIFDALRLVKDLCFSEAADQFAASVSCLSKTAAFDT